jgi:hypothetical protein
MSAFGWLREDSIIFSQPNTLTHVSSPPFFFLFVPSFLSSPPYSHARSSPFFFSLLFHFFFLPLFFFTHPRERETENESFWERENLQRLREWSWGRWRGRDVDNPWEKNHKPIADPTDRSVGFGRFPMGLWWVVLWAILNTFSLVDRWTVSGEAMGRIPVTPNAISGGLWGISSRIVSGLETLIGSPM